VDKLNYLTITRPDIAFDVSVVSQFQSAPKTTHWDVVVWILKYLKNVSSKGLLYLHCGTVELLVFQMVIGHVYPLIDDLPQTIVLSLEKILYHKKVRRRV